MASQEGLSAARVPYGARGDFPSAVDMGDKALYVDPSDNQALWQVQSGNWVKIALGGGGGGGATPGVPVLRGPYVVDYTDIPHDGDTTTLWTPQVGDVLLRLFADWQTGTGWDHGSLFIGQNVDGTVSPALNAIVATAALGVPLVNLSSLDNIETGVGQAATTDATGASMFNSAYVFHSTDPVHIQLAQTAGDDPTAGHVEIYTLIAGAVAP